MAYLPLDSWYTILAVHEKMKTKTAKEYTKFETTYATYSWKNERKYT